MAIRKKGEADSEQRTLIAVLLCMVLYAVWTFLQPPAPPVEAPPAESPSVAETPSETPSANPAVVVADAPVEERSLTVTTAQVSGELSSHGGSLRDLYLPGEEAPYEVTPIWTRVLDMVKGDAEGEWKPYGDHPGDVHLVSEDGVLLAAGSGEGFDEGDYQVSGSGPWVSIRHTRDGIEVQKTLRSTVDPQIFEAEVRFTNPGSTSWRGPLWIGTVDRYDDHSGMLSQYQSYRWPFGYADGDLEQPSSLEDLLEEPEVHEGGVGWYGTGDRYFTALTVIDQQPFQGGRLVFAPTAGTLSAEELSAAVAAGEAHPYGAFTVYDGVLEPNASVSIPLRIYLGERNLEELAAMGAEADQAVDFGFFGFFARLMLVLLRFIHGLVGSWGFAIILLTVAIKLAFWPLTKKSFVSGQKMQALGPQIQAIKEKFPNDSQRAGQEQMKLFQEQGVNPFGGCLPMVIQMPIWFALYSLLLYAGDVYHAEFFYLRDLTVMDPTGALPLYVGVVMMLQQRLTPMSPNMDPTQVKMMRLMPLVFVVFMFVFPAGLALYVSVNTTLSILQMWLVRRKYSVPQPATAK